MKISCGCGASIEVSEYERLDSFNREQVTDAMNTFQQLHKTCATQKYTSDTVYITGNKNA